MRIGFLSKTAITAVIIIAFIFILGMLFVRSGAYNVAATDPHWGLTKSLIDQLTTASIRNYASKIDSTQLEAVDDSLAGFGEYDEMCVDCHGAPGIGRTPSGRGLYPRGPTLSGVDTVWSTAELYWIVKNGIKMTGMPAFGPTHPDKTLLEIVAFVKHLKTISRDEYLHLRDSLGGEEHEEEHEHEPENVLEH
jgi:mono/diheme cytochrome c family protein